METVYVNAAEEKLEKIKKAAKDCGARAAGLSQADINRTLSEITGMLSLKITGAAHKKAPALFSLPEIIIFAGFAGNKLDAFLEAYRKAGGEPVKLKAVVTLTNSGWTLYELAMELAKEHAALNGEK